VPPMATAATADLSAPDKVWSLPRVLASNFLASPELCGLSDLVGSGVLRLQESALPELTVGAP
jgi:hypothetical protein